MRYSLSVIAISSLWAAAACSDGGTGVKLPPCASSFGSHVSTTLGSDTMLDPASDSGCVVFDINPSGSTPRSTWWCPSRRRACRG